MRAVLFVSVFVGMLWVVDTYSLQGRVMQASKATAMRLYKRTDYEIWKLKFYNSHQSVVRKARPRIDCRPRIERGVVIGRPKDPAWSEIGAPKGRSRGLAASRPRIRISA
jgi:hypothetical protein